MPAAPSLTFGVEKKIGKVSGKKGTAGPKKMDNRLYYPGMYFIGKLLEDYY